MLHGEVELDLRCVVVGELFVLVVLLVVVGLLGRRGVGEEIQHPSLDYILRD